MNVNMNAELVLTLIREGHITAQIPDLEFGFVAGGIDVQSTGSAPELLTKGWAHYITASHGKPCDHPSDCRHRGHFLYLTIAGFKHFETQLFTEFAKANAIIGRYPGITRNQFVAAMGADVYEHS